MVQMVERSIQRGWRWPYVMSSSSSNLEPAYLANVIIIAITVVVTVEGEINYLLLDGAGIFLREGKSPSSKLNSSPSES